MLCCPIAQLPSFIGGLNGLKESPKNVVVFWMTAEDHGVDDCAGSNKHKIFVSTEKPGTSFASYVSKRGLMQSLSYGN